MKLKVKFFDKKLLQNYLVLLSTISVLFSFVFIFIEIPDDNKISMGIGFTLILFFIYIIKWIIANLQNKTTLSINNSTMIIKIGDIFEEDELKVITFNEYFDTQVDNKIIADNTLNGIFIKTKIDDVNELDELIKNDIHLNEKIIQNNDNRLHGKKNRYDLGTIFQNNDYLLTAFTKFDTDNRAYLSMNDYINFLLNFWNEIDIIYNGRSVSIPLLGSGITRFKGFNTMSEQELLELLIWSFKISKIKFTYPSKVSIIIHKSKKDKINFFKLKED